MPTFSLIPPSIPFVLLFFLNFFSICALSAQDLSGAIRLPSEMSNGGGDCGFCSGIAEPASCPINCFRADPVCGDDGVTYWCGCPDALCHGARVVKLGACDVGNGVSLSVPGQALLLIHIVWLILLGFSMLFGLF